MRNRKAAYAVMTSFLGPLLLAACVVNIGETREFGFIPEPQIIYECADKDISPEGRCLVEPTDADMIILSLRLTQIACGGALDTAKLKRGDLVATVGGKNVTGLNLEAFVELVGEESRRESSRWTILRDTPSGVPEKKEVTIIPGESGDDYSCGDPGIDG